MIKLPKDITKWLIFAIITHGFIGSYSEILDNLPGRIATPLGNFYNDSIHYHYGHYLDSSELSKVLSTYNTLSLIGAIISTIFLIPLMDTYGRKNISVYLRSLIAFVACLLMIIAKSINAFEIFGITMVLIGVGKPLRIGVTKLYISECAPNSVRGFATLSISIMSLISILGCYFLALEDLLGTDDRWVYFAYISIGSIFLFVITGSFIPESPKYLKLKDKSMFDTVRNIKKFHGDDVDVDDILDEYEREFEMLTSTKTTLSDMVKDESLHDSLKLILVVTLFPSLGAIQILAVNSIPLKIRYGFTNKNALIFDTVFNFMIMPFMILLGYLIEKIGRKPILLLSMSSSLFSSIFMFITDLVYNLSGITNTTVILSSIFSSLQYISTGTGALIFYIILIADLLPTNSKSLFTQFTIIVSNIASIIVNYVFSTYEIKIGSFIHVPFIFIQVYFIYYIYRNFIETKQKAVFQNFSQIRSRTNSKIEARSRLTTSNFKKYDSIKN